MMMRFKSLVHFLYLIKMFQQLVETIFATSRSVRCEMKYLSCIWFFLTIFLLLSFKYKQSINYTALVKIIQSIGGVIVDHPVPPISSVYNNIDHIINTHIVMNVNSIFMIELNETLLPIMRIKEKYGLSKQHSQWNTKPLHKTCSRHYFFLNINITAYLLCKLYQDIKQQGA